MPCAHDISVGRTPLYVAAMAPLPAVYLAAGEGIAPAPADRRSPEGDARGRRRSRSRAARSRACAAPGWSDVVAVTGHCASAFDDVRDLLSGERFNDRFAEHGNVYSLWCARDVVRGGCYIVNSDVLFEDEIARRLVAARGSAVLCAADHGVDEESMKAVAVDGRLSDLSKARSRRAAPRVHRADADRSLARRAAGPDPGGLREPRDPRRLLRGRARRAGRVRCRCRRWRWTGSRGSRSTTTRTSRTPATTCWRAWRERRAAPLHGAAALPARGARPRRAGAPAAAR